MQIFMATNILLSKWPLSHIITHLEEVKNKGCLAMEAAASRGSMEHPLTEEALVRLSQTPGKSEFLRGIWMYVLVYWKLLSLDQKRNWLLLVTTGKKKHRIFTH